MAEPRISVRSAKAHDLAHRLARRDGRSIDEVVEPALEAYEAWGGSREPAAAFYARLARDHCGDVDLDSTIRESRTVNAGLEL
jgi:hypothetical protein